MAEMAEMAENLFEEPQQATQRYVIPMYTRVAAAYTPVVRPAWLVCLIPVPVRKCGLWSGVDRQPPIQADEAAERAGTEDFVQMIFEASSAVGVDK
jgi:hypothetical protein